MKSKRDGFREAMLVCAFIEESYRFNEDVALGARLCLNAIRKQAIEILKEDIEDVGRNDNGRCAHCGSMPDLREDDDLWNPDKPDHDLPAGQ